MNQLQKLLSEQLRSGKSLRDISKETGISHSNLSRYHRGENEPDSINLTRLAQYFGLEFYELLEPADSKKPSFDFGPSLEDQLAFQEWKSLSPDEKLQAVQLLRKFRADRKTQDQ